MFTRGFLGFGSKPMESHFGVFSEFTTHFSQNFSGDWGVDWGYDLGFDPLPNLHVWSASGFSLDLESPQRVAVAHLQVVTPNLQMTETWYGCVFLPFSQGTFLLWFWYLAWLCLSSFLQGTRLFVLVLKARPRKDLPPHHPGND